MQTLNLNGPSVAVQAEPETPTRDCDEIHAFGQGHD